MAHCRRASAVPADRLTEPLEPGARVGRPARRDDPVGARAGAAAARAGGRRRRPGRGPHRGDRPPVLPLRRAHGHRRGVGRACATGGCRGRCSRPPTWRSRCSACWSSCCPTPSSRPSCKTGLLYLVAAAVDRPVVGGVHVDRARQRGRGDHRRDDLQRRRHRAHAAARRGAHGPHHGRVRRQPRGRSCCSCCCRSRSGSWSSAWIGPWVRAHAAAHPGHRPRHDRARRLHVGERGDGLGGVVARHLGGARRPARGVRGDARDDAGR